MNAIKEFFKLAKMLFKNSPSDYEEVQLMSMTHFPFKGYKFMMWCGNMIYRAENEDTIAAYMETEKGTQSKNHENIHLYQAKDKKKWIKYYWKYFCEWVKGNPITHPASSAYYTIPYEMEAYANADNLEYLNTRTAADLTRYTIKNRNKTYKANKDNWIEYLKTL